MSKTEEFLNVNERTIKKIRQHYCKSLQDVQRDVNILKEWLRQQPHLPKNEGW